MAQESIKAMKTEPGSDLKTIEADAATIVELKRMNPTLPIFTSSCPHFAKVREINCYTITNAPLAIVRPQSETDVATIVKYAVAQDIPFCVRSGGHDYYGRSMMNGTLVIDMRSMDKIEVVENGTAANVQGGTLMGDLSRHLGESGLATVIGSCDSVSYAGFALFGGYGLLSGEYGMGNDNILGARLVNAKGEVIEADEELLYAIRGAGGAFGVVTELKVKVFPLKEV
jgi:FAD/FMN-containing dehydrogenase